MAASNMHTMVEEARTRLLDRKKRGAGFRVCEADTRLVVEGPPRSANSFTVRMLHRAAGHPSVFKIAHHSHSADNLISGWGYGLPLVVLARPPEEAVLSHCIYSGRTAERCARHYAEFFEAVAGLDGYVIGHFEEITTDFNRFLTRLKAIMPHEITLFDDLPAVLADVEAEQRAIVARRAKKAESDPVRQTPMPTAEREALKAELRESVLEYLSRHTRARDAYERVIATAPAPASPAAAGNLV